MSDEIKKDELVNAGEEKQLDEKALEQVVGGEAVSNGKHIPKGKLE